MSPYTFHCLLKILALCAALHDKPVATLTAIHAGAMMADGAVTLGAHEDDAVARAFIGSRPTWGSMLGPGTAELVGETWLAERMRRSKHRWLRRVWWLPQSAGIAWNVGGVVYTIVNEGRVTRSALRITDAPGAPGRPPTVPPVFRRH